MINEDTIIKILSERITSESTILNNNIKDLRTDVKDLEVKVDKIDKKSLSNAIWTKVIGGILLLLLAIFLIEAGIFSGYLSSGGNITIKPVTNISTNNSVSGTLKNSTNTKVSKTDNNVKKGLINR